MIILTPAWHYYDSNLRFNVEASVVYAVPAYILGYLSHKSVHRHLHAQDAKTKLMHKHIKEIHKKVHNG